MSLIQELPAAGDVNQLVTLLNVRIRQINQALGGASDGVSSAGATIEYGTHAQRRGKPVASFAAGSLWLETDRGVVYEVRDNAWKYASGTMCSAIASQPADLASGDAGFLWALTDYAHLLRWNGTGWEFVDAMGGYIQGRVVAPDGNGWQLCDGSATHYLHIAAGVVSEVSFTTPALTGGSGYYCKFGAAYAGATAASGPVAAGTGGLQAVTHSTGDLARTTLLPYFRR